MCESVGGTNLRVVLGIPGVERDRLKVQPAVEVDGRDDVLEGGDDALDGGDVLLLEGERGGGGGCLGRRRGGAGDGAGSVRLGSGGWF